MPSTTVTTPRSTDTFPVVFDDYAAYREALDAHEADEMDAPADWQSGAVTFDPYV